MMAQLVSNYFYLLSDVMYYNIFLLVIGKGPTQTYWLHTETKEGAILKMQPDASKMLKPLFRQPKNFGGKLYIELLQ